MAARRSAPGLAARLAVEVAGHEAPDDLVAARIALARRIVAAARRDEPLSAGLLVGSTALRRCTPDSDLDVVLIVEAGGDRPAFESRDLEDVHVEIERVTWSAALSMTAGEGWTWELRSAARLGCGLPVYDPEGCATRLRGCAAAQRPDARRFEATLRDIYLGLAALGGRAEFQPEHGEALRGILDNLALLTLLIHPRRYQKAKWALADLLHAGQASLVGATLACYGIRSNGTRAAGAALRRTTALVTALYESLGVPSHEDILAMGHAPEFAQASYVSRTLADAEDLAASGRRLESQYVARFAARLAAALASPPEASASLVDGLEARSGTLAALYREVFADAPAPRRRDFATALACADALLDDAASRPEAAVTRVSA
jgi:hypothetical protein